VKNWERRMFGILALGGGTVGFVLTSQYVMSQKGFMTWLLCFLAIAIYLWGMWCGLTLLEGRTDVLKYNRRYWLVQAPVLQSPLFTWTIWGGAHGTAVLQIWPVNLNFSTAYGGGFTFNALHQPNALAIGVNVVAMVLAAWLAKIEMKEMAAKTEALAMTQAAADVPAAPGAANEVT
jgi:hypothetical protein